jgi:hypothetical protein
MQRVWIHSPDLLHLSVREGVFHGSRRFPCMHLEAKPALETKGYAHGMCALPQGCCGRRRKCQSRYGRYGIVFTYHIAELKPYRHQLLS